MKYWMIVLMLLPGVASATAYKCMNQGGGTVYSTSPCDEAGLVPYVEGERSQAGTLVVHKSADGSYRTPGTVNGSPFMFVIDDSAPRTALSPHAAQDAGVQCPKHRHAKRPCGVTVHEIEFGSFSMDKVRVYIVPNLQDDVRLGRNVLRHLKLRRAGGALSLSRR